MAIDAKKLKQELRDYPKKLMQMQRHRNQGNILQLQMKMNGGDILIKTENR